MLLIASAVESGRNKLIGSFSLQETVRLMPACCNSAQVEALLGAKVDD